MNTETNGVWAVGGKERLDLILNGLDAALYYLAHTHLSACG
jgi:hypothetical protein